MVVVPLGSFKQIAGTSDQNISALTSWICKSMARSIASASYGFSAFIGDLLDFMFKF